MTERGAAALDAGPDRLAIGPSTLHWNGDCLVIGIEEVTFPVPSRIRGEVRVHPVALTGRSLTLDAAERHRWSPIAPLCRVELALDRPELRWSGTGYLDSNEGSAPLEQDFRQWDWCRAPTRAGATILYNTEWRGGGGQSLALRADRRGGIEAFSPPPAAALPTTLWRLPRPTRADAGSAPRVRQTLEDAPFYARSVLDTVLEKEPVVAVHESLSLDRFRTPWVQAMLPFRMPRRV